MAIQKSKVVLFCAVLLFGAQSASATKHIPREDPCEKVPLVDEIRGAEMVAAMTFIDFTDETKKVGRFRIKYAWKGDVKAGDEIQYNTEKYFSYSAKEYRDQSYYVFFAKKQGDVFQRSSCRINYAWFSFSLENVRVQEFNNAVIRSMQGGDSKK